MTRDIEPVAQTYTTPDSIARELPECISCCQTIELLHDAALVLPGQWMMNRDLGTPVFVLDPNCAFQIVQLSNGQLGIVTKGPDADHLHKDCLTAIMNDHFGYEMGDDR